jgi:hypothetical protein
MFGEYFRLICTHQYLFTRTCAATFLEMRPAASRIPSTYSSNYLSFDQILLRRNGAKALSNGKRHVLIPAVSRQRMLLLSTQRSNQPLPERCRPPSCRRPFPSRLQSAPQCLHLVKNFCRRRTMISIHGLRKVTLIRLSARSASSGGLNSKPD